MHRITIFILKSPLILGYFVIQILHVTSHQIGAMSYNLSLVFLSDILCEK